MRLNFYANVISLSLRINKIYKETSKMHNCRLFFELSMFRFKSKNNLNEKCLKIDNSKKLVRKK